MPPFMLFFRTIADGELAGGAPPAAAPLDAGDIAGGGTAPTGRFAPPAAGVDLGEAATPLAPAGTGAARFTPEAGEAVGIAPID
jgi:hypothetical protein